MRHKFREALDQVFSVDDTPHRIGLAFGLGTFLAMSALIGLHTILGLALPHLFRLSKRVTMAGVFINNPWTIVPIYSFCLWVGLLVTGEPLGTSNIDWRNLSATLFFKEMRVLIWPFVVGTTLVGVASAVAGYYIIRRAVTGFRKEHEQRG